MCVIHHWQPDKSVRAGCQKEVWYFTKRPFTHFQKGLYYTKSFGMWRISKYCFENKRVSERFIPQIFLRGEKFEAAYQFISN